MANNNTRTLAFQIDETLFQRIKDHLDRESARLGRKLTQKEFVLGLIEEALEAAERQTGEGGDTPQNPDAPGQDCVEPGEGEEDLPGGQDK